MSSASLGRELRQLGLEIFVHGLDRVTGAARGPGRFEVRGRVRGHQRVDQLGAMASEAEAQEAAQRPTNHHDRAIEQLVEDPSDAAGELAIVDRLPADARAPKARVVEQRERVATRELGDRGLPRSQLAVEGRQQDHRRKIGVAELDGLELARAWQRPHRTDRSASGEGQRLGRLRQRRGFGERDQAVGDGLDRGCRRAGFDALDHGVDAGGQAGLYERHTKYGLDRPGEGEHRERVCPVIQDEVGAGIDGDAEQLAGGSDQEVAGVVLELGGGGLDAGADPDSHADHVEGELVRVEVDDA